MRRALELAASPGVPYEPNPRVGCILMSPAGEVVGSGWHQGAGTAHAEVAALRAAGPRARGATAVVTLEPCNHSGRTGPCSRALIDAGVRRVVYAQADPNPRASGGAGTLAAAGIEVIGGVLADDAARLNEGWAFAVARGRPLVTWKVASTLDGRIAAADGSSRWITGPAARDQVHELRGQVGAVVIGTGTALADDPALTARRPDGTLAPRQPLRVVIGAREIPVGARLRDSSAPTRVFRHESPAQVLEHLARDEVRHVLLEAGPTLGAAFLRAGLVDRVIWYLAPTLLGSGHAAVADLGVTTIGGAIALRITGISQVGADVRVDATIAAAPA